MIAALSKMFTALANKYLPDAYVFALILTLLVFAIGIVIGNSPLQMIEFWGNGIWNLMNFSMQMTLILVTGFTLAKTNFIDNLINKLATFATGPISAVILVTIVSSLTCFINWGFGLIVSALFAKAISQRLKKINFGLILSSAYSGFLLWHGGLSGSIPLSLTSPTESIKALIDRPFIESSETIYSTLNITLLLATFLTILVVNYFMAKDDSNLKEITFDINNTKYEINDSTFSSKLENSYLLNFSIVSIGFIYLINHFVNNKSLTLNITILIFLILAMALSGNSKNFLNNFNSSVSESSGIILQFPFYAGLMGMVVSSGMALLLSNFFISISNEKTFLLFTYLSAGIVNFFIPSGGGQWIVQAPIIIPAAKTLGVDVANASMAIAWGDAWSNMVQPFWAIPLLSISGLSLKDMMGHSVMVFISSGIVSSLIFYFMS